MRRLPSVLFILMASCGIVRGGEPRSTHVFPPAEHGKGKLTYVGSVPLLVVAGTPEEMGEQIGVLAVKPVAETITRTVRDTVRSQLGKRFEDFGWLAVTIAANGVYAKFPDKYRREIEAMAVAGGVDRNILIAANTVRDLQPSLVGCSGLAVETRRSTTAGPLFGRNCDMSHAGSVVKLGLVVVYRPADGIPFAMVTLPGVLMFGTGMNASGLVLGFNSASGAADKSPEFNPDGTPTMVIGRRFLETCRSRQDAAKWSDQHPTMIQGIAAICDRDSAAIVEITPQSVAILEAAHGLAYCTNRFRSDKLRTIEAPDARYVKLAQSERLDTLAVTDVWRLLHDANQGAATIHSMVFEPAKATIHVAFGDGRTSASANNMTSIDLSPWLVMPF